MCWEASHQLKLKDEIESKNKLLRPLKKKSLGRNSNMMTDVTASVYHYKQQQKQRNHAAVLRSLI